MVFVASEEQLAVQPDLPAVLAAKPQLDRACLVRIKFGVSVAGDFLERADGLVQIHEAVITLRLEILPLHLAVEAVVFGVQVDALLGREHLLEAGAVLVIERSDDLPVGHPAEHARQADGRAELLQLLRDVLDLVHVARGLDRGLIFGHRVIRLAGLGERGGFVEQKLNSVASQLRARVIAQPGDQALRLRGIVAHDEFVGEAACARMMLGVAHELLQGGDGQLAAGGQLARGDGVHGGAQPVQGESIRAIHRSENGRQCGGFGGGELFPRFGSLGVAEPFGADGADDLDGISELGR